MVLMDQAMVGGMIEMLMSADASAEGGFVGHGSDGAGAALVGGRRHRDLEIVAVLLEQNDEYQLQNRYMQIEGMTPPATPQIAEVPPLQITPKAA